MELYNREGRLCRKHLEVCLFPASIQRLCLIKVSHLPNKVVNGLLKGASDRASITHKMPTTNRRADCWISIMAGAQKEEKSVVATILHLCLCGWRMYKATTLLHGTECISFRLLKEEAHYIIYIMLVSFSQNRSLWHIICKDIIHSDCFYRHKSIKKNT